MNQNQQRHKVNQKKLNKKKILQIISIYPRFLRKFKDKNTQLFTASIIVIK